MALERGLRVNTPLEPERRTGWIGIDFDDSERVCRSSSRDASFSTTAPAAAFASARTSTPPTKKSTLLPRA